MVFDREGRLIHVINTDGAEIIRFFHEGILADEAVKKIIASFHIPEKVANEFIANLISEGILTNRQETTRLTWIDHQNPQSLISADVKRFHLVFNQYLSKIFGDNSSLIDSYQEFIPFIGQYFPREIANKNVIEIGCGNGYYSEFLKEKKARVVSTDIALERLRQVKARWEEKVDIHIPIIVTDAESLSFKDNEFDLVLCVFVLEHVIDIYKVIEEISRIARENARVIITIPSLSLRETLIHLLKLRKPVLNFEHFHVFGLFCSDISWCRSTGKLLKKMKNENILIENIRGVNICGLNEGKPFRKKFYQLIDKIIGSIYPFNRLGAQTIIIGRRK